MDEVSAGSNPAMLEPVEDICALTFVRRVAALLNEDPRKWEEGTALPHGWEFILFTPDTPQQRLRSDGHHYQNPDATADDTKMMLGGRRSRYLGDIPIGARVNRTSMVVGERSRTGSAGAMRIVTRENLIFVEGSDTPTIQEHEDMIYLPIKAGIPRSRIPIGPPMQHAEMEVEGYAYVTDETKLFRYSALTNNAHRIHYDYPHATDREGYPGLVVNGGLTALMLVETFRAHTGREAKSIATKMMLPLFCGGDNSLHLEQTETGYRVWARNDRGATAAEAMIR